MKLDNVRRIIVEDFKEEDRETVAKLGDILNIFMEQVYVGLQKNVNFSNLNQDLIKITVKVNSSGTPLATTKFSSVLRRIEGIMVVKAVNKTSAGTYPTGGVVVSFDQNAAGLYTIRNITGLQANSNYELTLVLIGSDN